MIFTPWIEGSDSRLLQIIAPKHRLVGLLNNNNHSLQINLNNFHISSSTQLLKYVTSYNLVIIPQPRARLYIYLREGRVNESWVVGGIAHDDSKQLKYTSSHDELMENLIIKWNNYRWTQL